MLAAGAPVVPIIFYRSVLLAADTAPIDALCEALAARGLAPAPLVVPSLKDAQAGAFVRGALQRLAPSVIVTTTAFAAGGAGETSPLDGVDAPVLQAVIATTRRAAWQESPRGLGPADLAMHVVLPELDGRVLAGAIAFKDALAEGRRAWLRRLSPAGPSPTASPWWPTAIAALVRLRQTPRSERRDRRADARLSRRRAAAPAMPSASTCRPACWRCSPTSARPAIGVSDRRTAPPNLLEALESGTTEAALSLQDYRRLLAALPAEIASTVRSGLGRSGRR